MAQADWDFANYQGGGSTYQGGYDGTARLHSALSSPLAGEGSYCREYARLSGGGNNDIVEALIKTSVNGGEFDQITSGFSWSVRAWLRQEDTTNTAIGIGIKLGGGLFPDGAAGYRVTAGHYTAGTQDLELHMGSEVNAGNSSATGIWAGNVTAGTWVKVRMDVIPIGTSQDTIEIYTGTGTTGSEIWTLRHTETVLNTDSHYCDWGHASSGRVGYQYLNRVGTLSPSGQCMIDRFQVFKEAV